MRIFHGAGEESRTRAGPPPSAASFRAGGEAPGSSILPSLLLQSPSLHHPQLRSRLSPPLPAGRGRRGAIAAGGGEREPGRSWRRGEGERAPPAVRIGAFLLLNELLSAVPSDSKSGAVEISSEFVVWLGPARAEQQAWLWWESGRGAAAPGCLAGRVSLSFHGCQETGMERSHGFTLLVSCDELC